MHCILLSSNSTPPFTIEIIVSIVICVDWKHFSVVYIVENPFSERILQAKNNDATCSMVVLRFSASILVGFIHSVLPFDLNGQNCISPRPHTAQNWRLQIKQTVRPVTLNWKCLDSGKSLQIICPLAIIPMTNGLDSRLHLFIHLHTAFTSSAAPG